MGIFGTTKMYSERAQMYAKMIQMHRFNLKDVRAKYADEVREILGLEHVTEENAETSESDVKE